MPYTVDPETGLPVDENGNLVSAADAGSDQLTEQPEAGPVDLSQYLENPRQPEHVKSRGVSASSSFSGITPGGLDMAARVMAPGDKATQQWADQDLARTNSDIAKYRGHINDEAAGIQEEADKSREFEAENARILQQKADHLNHWAEMDERSHAEARAAREQYISSYREQLAGVRELAMQSGNPYNSMSKGDAIGLAGAQFAQGFLAARGIHIDVAGQVDSWVNRSIQEHQMKVQNARAGAEDQLHLYEIARQNSQDDAEARARYRGYVIQSLQSSIEMNASRFNSQIGDARAKVQVAKLQTEADITERGIADAHQTRYLGVLNAMTQRAGVMGNLANQRAERALAERRQNWEESPQNPKNLKAQPSQGIPLYDPETGPKGELRVIGYIDPKDKGALKEAREKRAMTAAVYKQLDKLEAAREAAMKDIGRDPSSTWVDGVTGGIPSAARSSEAYRRYLRERTVAIQTIRAATTGKAFGDKEAAEYEVVLPNESPWESGNNEIAIPQLKEKLRQDFQATADTYLTTGAGTQVSPTAKGEWTAHNSPESDTRSLVATDLSQAAGADTAEHAKVSVATLASMAVDPKTSRKIWGDMKGYTMTDNDDELKEAAVTSLKTLAAEGGPASEYATRVLDKLEKDPARLRKDLKLDQFDEPAASYSVTRLPTKK